MPAPTGYNQGPEDGWEITQAILEKSSPKQGFGLAITGGAENPNHVNGDTSILVTDVVEKSPAAFAGVRKDDIIVSVNGNPAVTHRDTVNSLKTAGLQAILKIKRPAPKKIVNNAPKDTESAQESDRGRNRKKPRDMENASEKKRSSRSRSRNPDGEGEENGEKKRSRSRSRGRDAEDGDGKPRRSRSKHREDGEEGDKPRRSRSKHRGEGDEEGDKPKRSRSKHRGEGEEDKPRRSRSKARPEGEEGESKSRSRSKSRGRDDLTRSKSRESLAKSRSKSKENLSGLPKDSESIDVILERGDRGFGFSLGIQFFLRDFAPDSPAAKNIQLDKGDILLAINDKELQELKLADCINLIKESTQSVKLKVVKKPKEEKKEEPPKQLSKPTRPAEAPEAEVIVKKEKDVSDETDTVPKERHRRDKSRDREKSRDPDKSRDRKDRSPPRDQLNDTKDSWAAASPAEKQRYQSQSQAQPNQEVENMDAKIERLKVGRKFERRMSQLPNARVISFHKTGSVGIQVAGGNAVGIFVAAIRPDSTAAKEGLKTGDQIIMCNEIDFSDITREEAVLILLALPDDVSLVVEDKKNVFDAIKKDLGDNFFIRTNFDHLEKSNQNELIFQKAEIFNVRDTMYQGLIGYWQAQRVGKNSTMLERGVLPNKSRAEQLAIAQKMEDRQANTPGRSKVKRRGSIGGTLKRHKFVSQDRLDESSFAEGVQTPAYERVVLKVADFMRPVVILGALADLVRFKLLEEMPDRFDVPTPMDVGRQDDRPYADSIKISEIRNVIAKNKHCLLDIIPEGIEMLTHAQLCPIVILLKSPSRGVVKEMRTSLVRELMSSPTGVPGFRGDPLTPKQVKRVFSNAKKLEAHYPYIFTAKINTHIAGGDVLSREFYIKLKEIIFTQQAQSAWMPEEKPSEVMDDMVFHPPNYMSYMSGADSDTEGESTTSSPVMARKHLEDEESPLPSPTDEKPPPQEVVEPKERRSKHRHRSHDRDDDDESPDRESRRNRHHEKKRHHKSRSRDHSRDREEKEEEDDLHDNRDPPPPSFKPEQPPYREPPQPEYREDPPYREPPHHEYRDDYRSPPKTNEYQYEQQQESRPPPPRDDYRDYRQPPPAPRDDMRRHEDELEDVPVLRDPSYEMPKPIPDSPPTRRPPEVRTKPAVNAVKVFPNEFKKDLRKVQPEEEEENDFPPYRPPPPPEKEDVPEKVLTLQERMNKFQQKVTSNAPPPKRAPADDDVPPPARPAAPRNYIIDSRYRGQQQQPPRELYAQNTYKPQAQFPEVKRVTPSSSSNRQPQYNNQHREMVEEPYANVRHTYGEESEAPPPPPSSSRHPTQRQQHPGYDYVKPYKNLKHNHINSQGDEPTHDYDYPRQSSGLPPLSSSHDHYDYPRNGGDNDATEPHYMDPNSRSRDDGYRVPPPTNRSASYDDESYPPYQLPSSPSSYSATARSSNGDRHDMHAKGEDEPKVIATARGIFDHRGGLLESAETNVSIYIPAGALPEGKKQEIYFKVCQDSKYMPPLDSNSGETLLSPLVMCGPHGLKFRKPIELRLPHKGASNDSMAFSLKSSDSPVGHPGQWKNVKLGAKDLDAGRAYQVTEDTVSVLVDHF